ncbi:hypothetical protein DQ04_02681030 [Trypanosoma grayi]|uniref:hypothetical protein n=1 Tax=Trypanosoma grayi TaxID=71804 RepID=UPI0004F4036D|nr:hypothetical protein DQ04_02681030 [Trypanosoma grayi]KEG11380.1 hypothetical protein DQ04_02681030 [Trypanosoma grayi]
MEGARPKKVVRVTRAGASAGSGDASSAPPSNSPNNTARNTDYKTNDVDENKNGTPRDQPVETPRSTRADATPVGPTQVVQTVEEGNALVKRLRQLESENASLSNALTKVCDENVKLAGHVSQREARYAELVSAPLASTSVLHSLFEPEKTGWFGGSKSAAREKLEQLAEELQSEFLEYRASHASTNDEVQALLGELQSAHANAQKLSAIVHQQQEAISRGPLAVTVRIASGETDVENISLADLRHELERRKELEEELRQELRRARDELQAKTVEIGRQQHELQALRPAGGLVSEREQQHLTDEIARLEAQVTQLRDALATEEQLHGIKLNENKGLTQRLKEMEEQLRIATSSATEPPAQKEPSLPAPCKECEVLQQECDAAQERVRTLNRTIQRLEAHLAEVQQANEKEVDELQRAKSQLEEQLMSRVPRTDLAAAEMLNKNLQHELDMAKARVKHVEGLLERERGSSSQNMQGPSSGSGTLDDAKVLEALERNKERISRLEFQRQQLTDEATQLREAASAKEEELVRAARATQEDKQRINFLLKRCVTLTNDLKSITAARDELSEQHEHSQLELSKLRRQGQELVTLQQRIDDLKQKNEGLQSRLSCVEELENELVKAKETVAYMELAQSRSINMSQFAELQAKNTKLENTLEPIKRQLEEAKKELERIKTENESLHAVMARQQNAIKTHEEQAAALHANDAKLREKMNQLSADNTRLRGMNDTLEAQMSDMQDGIKEMAVKLEQERGKARAAAETTYRGEIAQLQAKLNVANETLAGVRSAQDAFVPRGIHDALAVEKERLEEDNKRKVFDLDKLKSEILIYRQTIDDLEAENEEHLRQVEGLQSTHKKERAATADRLTAEQKKLADANKELDGLRTRVEEMTQREERLLAQQKEMEEAAQKHRRAFEDKCRQEEKLLATVAATNREMEVQREELQRVATQQKKEAEVAAGAAEDLRHREDECQALQAELRRAKEEKAANERDLAKLRDASKGSGSCGNAAATAVAVVGGSNSTNSSGGLECCKGTTDPPRRRRRLMSAISQSCVTPLKAVVAVVMQLLLQQLLRRWR